MTASLLFRGVVFLTGLTVAQILAVLVVWSI